MDVSIDSVAGLNRLKAVMDTSDVIWLSLLGEFPVLNAKNVDLTQYQLLNYDELKATLEKENLIPFVYELILLEIENDVRKNVAPKFVANFKSKCEILDGFRKFQESVKHLYTSVLGVLNSLHKLEDLKLVGKKTDFRSFGTRTAVESYKMTLIGAILFDLPTDYTAIIQNFYSVSFKVFCNCGYPAFGTVEMKCFEHTDQTFCNCMKALGAFDCVNKILSEIDLLEKLVGSTLTKLVEKWTQYHVDKTCRGAFDSSNIKVIERWIKDVILVWLTRIYKVGKITSKRREGVLDKAVATFKDKLLQFVYEAYGKLLIDQLFNIIIEYPDSFSAIEDLRICLQRNNLQQLLIEKTKESFITRLLHPGVNTPDILTAFVASIQTLQQLDPSGMLLDAITSPIRSYLRSRDDTVHCIVTMLTDEGTTDLSDELTTCKKITLNDVVTSADEDMENWENWLPDPIEVVPDTGEKRDHSADIITMLVNVFGSRQLFIDEYRKLLADRFLSHFTHDTNKEIRNLELLKLRFGDSELGLSKCEVMLKDVHDSLRIGTHLQNDPSYGIQALEFNVRALFLSSQFWPPFKDNPLKLPDIVMEHFEVYTKAFETYKSNRTLSWKPFLGVVSVEIELKDRTLNLSVSPVLATIIWHFQTKSEWNLADLSKVMMVSCSVLRRRISFWQSQGILTETAQDTYAVLEESPNVNAKPRQSMQMLYEEDETESAVASAQDQREEELQVFWSYIVGMLTNLESLTLDRIHQMLKMFASQGSATKEVSAQQLRNFLDKKVKEHLLIVSGGFYKLAK